MGEIEGENVASVAPGSVEKEARGWGWKLVLAWRCNLVVS